MYAGNLQQELNKYTNVKVYNLYKGTTITPEEKRRINSFHSILLECSAEFELIANIINTSRIKFLSLLDIISNSNHDDYRGS